MIAGGSENSITGTGSEHSAIGGGNDNEITGSHSTIAGGYDNLISGDYSAIPGGQLLQLGDNSVGFNGFANLVNLQANPNVAYLGDVDVWIKSANSDINKIPNQLRFYEAPYWGTNYTSFRASTGMSGNVDYVLPGLQGAAGTVLTNDGSGALSWTAGAGSNWGLTGNTGTTPGTNFLGTVDNVNFELHVNSSGAASQGRKRVLQIEPNIESANIIWGYNANIFATNVVGATISGGGYLGNPNRVYDSYGTIGGGYNNTVGRSNASVTDEKSATVGGGTSNIAEDQFATVGGGFGNEAIFDYATIAGGESNSASNGWSSILGGKSNSATGGVSTIAGGESNGAGGAYTFIGGGQSNVASGDLSATVAGKGLVAQNYAQTVLGHYNRAQGNNLFPVQDDDRLLIIGNGLAESTPTNAFEVSANGHSIVYHNKGTGGATPTGNPGPVNPALGIVKGGTYQDNILYAWGKVVPGAFNTVSVPVDFGVGKVAWSAASTWDITLNTVDENGSAVSLTSASIVANLVNNEGNPTCAFIFVSDLGVPGANQFRVRIRDTNCSPIDLPFTFHVAGRP